MPGVQTATSKVENSAQVLSVGHIFSNVRPFYERAVSDLDPQRSMHRPVWVTHNSFIEGSHMTKIMASVSLSLSTDYFWWKNYLLPPAWPTRHFVP
jgi:hypothetical protein